MKKYIAACVQEEDGRYSVYFPDVPGAITWGHNLEEAFDNAADALGIIIEDMAAKEQALPVPRKMEEIKKEVKKIRLRDKLAYHESRVFYQFIPAPELPAGVVRFNVSMPKFVLEKIDRKAKTAGLTRSGFLAEAAKAYAEGR